MAGYRTWIIVLSLAGLLLQGPDVNGQAPLAVDPVVAAPASQSAALPPADQLPALAQAAKGQFVPITKADLARARTQLQEASTFLDSRFQTAGPEAQDWRKYVMWDELQQQLARPEGPDLSVLDKIYARFAAGYDGLELVWFETVGEALRQYLNTARAIGDQELPDQYRKLLDELAKHLETYLREPSPDEASAIATAIDWLQSAGQAKELVAAIRAHFVHPNVYAQASCELIATMLVRGVDEIQPVEDCILGVPIYGTGHNYGQANAELVPNMDRAQVDVVFLGTVNSSTVGYAERGVRVYSNGLTCLTTRKPLFVEPERIWSAPSTAHAQTATNIADIDAPRRLVERVAWRRATRQQPEANAIAAQHAAQRASARADTEGDPRVARADQRYQDQVRMPLYERNIYPQRLHYYTTARALHAVGLEVGAADLAASTLPPPVADPLDLTVQVHQSMVNNMAEGLFGGAVMTAKRFEENLTQLLGSVPDRFKQEPDAEPWTITFSRRQPIAVHFLGNNQFTVTVRGRAYQRGDERYPGMNVTATYQVQSTPEGVKAIRQGELAIFPPGFQPGAGKQLSVRQQVLRDLLKRRFEKMFDNQFRPRDIQLRNQQDATAQDLGSLTLVGWDVTPGWMAMNWKRLPPPAVATAEPAVVRPVVLTEPFSAVEAMPVYGQTEVSWQTY